MDEGGGENVCVEISDVTCLVELELERWRESLSESEESGGVVMEEDDCSVCSSRRGVDVGSVVGSDVGECGDWE